MKTGWVGLLLLLILPGCAGQHLAANDDAVCRSGGADRGSEAYSGCRSELANEREQVAAQYIQNQQKYEPDVAAQMQYQPPPMPSPAANCMTSGGSAFTNCN
ncbi:MAG TPA: hypothetical protein VGI20_07810 [Rhizomicrobium sp.]|jgi:hypothetical protein